MDIDEKMNIEIKGNEAIFTRIINAHRAPLFRAWTEPELLALWWGPHGFENLSCFVDLRTGGGYKIVMCSPDGIEYSIRGSYLEIAAPDRLSFTLTTGEQPDIWSELLSQFKIERGPDSETTSKFFITVNFKELNEKTEINILIRFGSEAECNAMMSMGTAEGWAQSLERLSGLIRYLSE